MAVVIGHVINEYMEVADRPGSVADSALQRGYIGNIGLAVPGPGQSRFFDPLHQFLGRPLGVVDEGDQRALSRKCLGHASANPGATAGNEHTAPAQ